MNKPIDVEVLTASGCGRCKAAISLVQSVVNEFPDDAVRYREVNVVKAIDYAVQLGVLSTPAIAIARELVFAALPSKDKLHHAIAERLSRRDKMDNAP